MLGRVIAQQLFNAAIQVEERKDAEGVTHQEWHQAKQQALCRSSLLAVLQAAPLPALRRRTEAGTVADVISDVMCREDKPRKTDEGDRPTRLDFS